MEGQDPVTNQPVSPEPRTLTLADAKHDLLWAWFAANPNQPMPEGRAAVHARTDVIWAAAVRAAEFEVEAINGPTDDDDLISRRAVLAAIASLRGEK